MGNWFSNDFEESFPITIRERVYGWIKDIPDQRDIFVSFPEIAKFRTIVDLRDTKLLPKIYNQGNLGSCTSNVLCSVFEYEYRRQFKNKDINPSRNFLYYNERVVKDCVDFDSGSSIRDGIKILNKLGVCDESLCSYNTNFTTKPTVDAYLNAQKYKGVKYKRVKKDIDNLKSALTLNYPIIVGFTVYESFENLEGVEKTGIFVNPNKNEKVLGGHVVLICGYNDKTQLFLIRNSLGEEWGENGYFWMSYSFVLSGSCSDFWIIEKIKKPDDYRTMADIVRGYQIREDVVDTDSDSDSDSEHNKTIVKSESKSSIVELQ